MKRIITRNLSLSVTYILIDKKYIPLDESSGTVCDNCNKLIANIATVQSETGSVYNIGFDCLETLLINNHLLNEKDIAEYERVKPMFNKIIRVSKKIKELIANYPTITGLKFEKPQGDYFPFYILQFNSTTSRNNDYFKLKDVDYEILIETFKHIFPKLTIIS